MVSHNPGFNCGYPLVPTAHPPDHTRALTPYDPRFDPGWGDEQIDLRMAWHTILRYRRTILTIVCAVVGSTVIATLLMRPVYRGTALAEINPAPGVAIRLNAIDQTIEPPHREHLETQRRILSSQSVAQAVIERLHLRDHPEFTGRASQAGFINGLKELVRAVGGGAERHDVDRADPLQDRQRQWLLVRNFLDRVDVKAIRDSNLVAVSFDSFEPDLAAQGANAIIEEFVRLNDRRRFHSASSAKEFLEREIASAEARLQESEQRLNDFARKNRIFDVDDRTDLVGSRVSELSAELTRAVSARIRAESLYGQLQADSPSFLPPSLQSTYLLDLKQNLSSLSREYKRLARVYKPGYPRLQQLNAGIDQLRASVAAEVANIRVTVASDLGKARRRETGLRAELDAHKNELLNLKDRAVQYHILKRDWETNRKLHAGLLAQMKDVGVSVGMEVNSASVIDPAQVPVRPYRPKLLVNATVGLGVGLCIALGLAFLLGHLDDTVRTSEDFEAVSGLASLGLVPKVETVSPARGTPLATAAGRALQSPITEALRSVRINVTQRVGASARRMILVTSAVMGEGKTTMATNLAIVLAQGGLRVLLVDADLRRPLIHSVFGIHRSPGLSGILSGDPEPCVHETEIEGLSVLPAGATPHDPATLLGAIDMEVLRESADDPFDYVIIDSPPVLGLADSAVIASKVDGVILVSAAGTRRRGVLEAVKRLRLVRAPLLGGVLNMVDVTTSGYGYYGTFYAYSRTDSEPVVSPTVS